MNVYIYKYIILKKNTNEYIQTFIFSYIYTFIFICKTIKNIDKTKVQSTWCFLFFSFARNAMKRAADSQNEKVWAPFGRFGVPS